MAFIAVPDSDCTPGDVFEVKFGLLINGVEPPTNTNIKATLVDVGCSTAFLKNDSGQVITRSCVPLGTSLTIGSTTYIRPWVVSFTGSQTAQLLDTPTDLTSSLKRTVTKHTGDDGYPQVWLELQVGNPYSDYTKHIAFSVKKGAIPQQIVVDQENQDNGFDANFRNLNDTQVAVSDRVPLKIDGLRTQGAFNNLYPGLWDPATSRIHPNSLTQKFDARIILEVVPTVTGSLLTLDLDIGTTTPILIYNDVIQLFRLEKTVFTRYFPFYVSQTFMDNGGRLNVSCTDPVAISNASLYLRLVGGSF